MPQEQETPKITINTLIAAFKMAQKKEYDGTLAISGFVGEGKSTFAIPLLKAYYEVTTIKQFKKLCEKFLVYNRKDLYRLATKEKGQFIIADESVNLLFRREWMKDNQIILLKAFDVCRDNQNIFVFNIPSFWALDSHTVQTRIRLWVHVDKQKFAHIFRPLRGPFAMDVWARKWNEKLHEKRKGLKFSPNFIDTITFPPLTPEEYIVYKEIKAARRYDLEGKGEAETEQNITTKELIQVLKQRNPKVSNAGIGDIVGCKREYVNQVLRKNKYLEGREGPPTL